MINLLKVFKKKAVESAIPLLVVSYGGVGSKQMIKGLYPNESLEKLSPILTHSRDVPATLPHKKKVIYLYGNPMNCVISFFKRREVIHDRHGYYPKYRAGIKNWAQSHCENVGGDWKSLDVNWGLKEYLENGADLFRLEEHFDLWHKSHRKYPILFLRYETMWDHVEEIINYAGGTNSCVDAFPKKILRSSNWTEENITTQKGLMNIYGSFNNKIESMKDIELVEASQ